MSNDSEHNPFLEGEHGLVYRLPTKQRAVAYGVEELFDAEGNPAPETMTFRKTKRVDSEAFVKIYADGIDLVANVSKGAHKVLMALLRVYRDDNTNWSDVIHCTFKTAQQFGYQHGESTWYKAIRELQAKEVIADNPRGEGWHFLNPSMFYKGDRVALVTDYVRITSE